MKKTIIYLFFFLSFNLINIQAEALKVGAILPLTGDLAQVGLELRRGLEIATKESGDEIELIIEDDNSFNKSSAVNAVHKLIKVDKVDVILIAAVNTVSAVDPILKDNDIPSLIIWDSNRKILNFKSNVFGFGFSTEYAGQEMANFAFADLNSKSVAIVSVQDEWSEIISSAFKEQFKLLGGRIVSKNEISLTEVDLRTIASRIVAKKPDAIYFPLFGSSLTSLVKQLRAKGYQGKLLTADGFSKNEIEILKKHSEGIYVSQVNIKDKYFFKLYEKYFSKNSIINISFAALSYDSLRFLKDISYNLKEKKLNFSSDHLVSEIKNYEFHGFTGCVNFSKKNLSSKKEDIYIVADAKLKSVKNL